MQNADRALIAPAGTRQDGRRRSRRQHALSVFCVLHAAFLISCAANAPLAFRSPQARAVASVTDAVSALHVDLLALTHTAGVQRGSWGIVVQSLDNEERLFELNPHALLVPASVAKLVSAATAADAVGWNYAWSTQLEAAGEVRDGVLSGDLIVTGGGDPATGGRGGDDAIEAFITALKRAGIRRIDGRVVGDDDALEDGRPAFAWAWDDLGYPSGALYGALNYAENKTLVTIGAGSAAGAATEISLDASSQGRPLLNRTVTVARGAPQLIWAEQRPGEIPLTIAGSIPAGARPARLTISAGNPTTWFVTVLRNRLILEGIEVTGAAVDVDDLDTRPISTQRLATYRSHPLGEITQPMLKESINLYAEAAMRLNAATASGAIGNDAALDGFNARMQAWGIPREGFQMVDGSGLSRRDVLAADTLVTVLRRMYDATGASPWMRALPIAGVDGSLDTRLKGTLAEGNLRAKTGTMSNIRSLAGYVTTADGEHLAFAILLNDFEGTGAQALQAIDAIAVKLATFRR
jgi:D-alanyl-D-alanine carboxypeptidase/D-alanyl-D-alanine-endopeptidase (penicillin-binding protein 4)